MFPFARHYEKPILSACWNETHKEYSSLVMLYHLMTTFAFICSHDLNSKRSMQVSHSCVASIQICSAQKMVLKRCFTSHLMLSSNTWQHKQEEHAGCDVFKGFKMLHLHFCRQQEWCIMGGAGFRLRMLKNRWTILNSMGGLWCVSAHWHVRRYACISILIIRMFNILPHTRTKI